MSILYCEGVFVALGIELAMSIAMLSYVPCRLYNIFPHYLIKGTVFEKKNN